MLHSGTMPLIQSILDQIDLTSIVDIGITALLIYWLFKLIRGTRAVRLVIGVSVLVIFYGLAVAFDLRLLTQIMQAGAVVGVFALVVVFQPELRRALERIGRVGSFGWLLSPADSRAAVHVSTEVARAAAELSAVGQGALIVLERETGLEEVAETGVMIHGDVSVDLLGTIFTPKSPLHDGAVIIRDDRVVAAGALLPLAETSIHTERFGTRHRAALGHHRADRRGGRGRIRGERPDQPRRTGPDRAQPQRGGAGPGHPDPARPGRRPSGRLRLAIGDTGSQPPGSLAATARARPPGRSPGDAQRDGVARRAGRGQPGAGRAVGDAGRLGRHAGCRADRAAADGRLAPRRR